MNIKFHHLPGNSDFLIQNSGATVDWVTAGMDIPLKMKGDVLLFSPLFETYLFSSASLSNKNLYGFALPVSYLKQWKNQKWKTSFTLIPRLSSDLENISSKDYQLGGAVLAVYKKNEKLKYKFGAYYNNEFFGFFMLPLLGIDWNITNRLNLFGVLPGSMSLEFKVHSKFYTGISFRSITNSFRLFSDTYFKIQDNQLKLFIDFYPLKNLVMNVETGHSFFRKYSTGFKNNNGENESDLKYTDGILIKAGIAYRFRLKDQ